MSIHFPPLFHWTPAVNRIAIMQDGLVPYSPAVSHDGYAYPYICLGTSPSSAWGLSGDMDWGSEIEEWDLWQVVLQDGDEVTVRGEFAPYIREIRVRNAIAAERMWWVASRTQLPAVETSPAKTRRRTTTRGKGK